jgi:hypothetical protein
LLILTPFFLYLITTTHTFFGKVFFGLWDFAKVSTSFKRKHRVPNLHVCFSYWEKPALYFTPQKTDLICSIFLSLSLSTPRSYPLPPIMVFFLLFVGFFWPDQRCWPLRYASVYLPPCYVVHILLGPTAVCWLYFCFESVFSSL